MMQMSFSELFMILLVALLVIKPERLPQVAKTIGRCVQWLRRTVTQVKQEIMQLKDEEPKG
jgi:sec-independent protein translocase protein TatB